MCTSKYKSGTKHIDTKCEKVPKELCGAKKCKVQESEEEECHNKEITSLVDVPEEICTLQPIKQCQFVTKLGNCHKLTMT